MIEPGIDGRVTDRNGWTWRHLVDAWYCERDEDGTWVDVSYTWRELVAVFGPVSSVEDAT